MENDFLERLREEARLTVYRALAPMDPPPPLAFEDHARAAAAGIELPEAPAELRPWVPPTAEAEAGDDPPIGRFRPVGPDALVVEYEADPPATQPFYRAARRAHLAPRLFAADPRLAGYGWYDRLPRLTGVTAQIDIDGVTFTQETLQQRFTEARGNGAPFDPPDRVERIVLSVDLSGPDGTRSSSRYPADVLFLDACCGWLSDAHPLIAADSDIDAEDLARLLRHAYFRPCRDIDVDWPRDPERPVRRRGAAHCAAARRFGRRSHPHGHRPGRLAGHPLALPEGPHRGHRRSRRGRVGQARPGARRLSRGNPIPAGPAPRTRSFYSSFIDEEPAMQLITPELRERLIANGKRRGENHVPVVKFFNPVGAATWLVTEMDPEENDHLFGLADMGMGFPELGGISLSELQNYRGPLGIGIERDLYFKARYALSTYTEAARAARRIVESGPLLEDAARSHRARDVAARDVAVRRTPDREAPS